MSTINLLSTLEKIASDVDVECTCHLRHGPMCPKRLAQDAARAHRSEPPVPRGLSDNREIVEKAARGVAGNPANLLHGDVPWEQIAPALRDGYIRDVELTLRIIDDHFAGVPEKRAP